MIRFNENTKNYSYLTNAHTGDEKEVLFYYKGLPYRSAASAYFAQSIDSSKFDSEYEYEKFTYSYMSASPKEAREMTDPTLMHTCWEYLQEDIMADVVFEKFRQNRDLCGKLLATGDEELIYDVPDTLWGSGCDGSGENLFGRILMDTRDYIRDILEKKTDTRAAIYERYLLWRNINIPFSSWNSIAADWVSAVPDMNLTEYILKYPDYGITTMPYKEFILKIYLDESSIANMLIGCMQDTDLHSAYENDRGIIPEGYRYAETLVNYCLEAGLFKKGENGLISIINKVQTITLCTSEQVANMLQEDPDGLIYIRAMLCMTYNCRIFRDAAQMLNTHVDEEIDFLNNKHLLTVPEKKLQALRKKHILERMFFERKFRNLVEEIKYNMAEHEYPRDYNDKAFVLHETGRSWVDLETDTRFAKAFEIAEKEQIRELNL